MRICAEDPAHNYRPCTGTLGLVAWPKRTECRVDTWVETGVEVSGGHCWGGGGGGGGYVCGVGEGWVERTAGCPQWPGWVCPGRWPGRRPASAATPSAKGWSVTSHPAPALPLGPPQPTTTPCWQSSWYTALRAGPQPSPSSAPRWRRPRRVQRWQLASGTCISVGCLPLYQAVWALCLLMLLAPPPPPSRAPAAQGDVHQPRVPARHRRLPPLRRRRDHDQVCGDD